MPINRKQYPVDWVMRSRFIRIYRANNKCERCGATNGAIHPTTGAIVELQTCHIYQDLKRSSLLDLAAWCQVCHNTHDAFIRARNREINRISRLHKSGQLFFTFYFINYYSPADLITVRLIRRKINKRSSRYAQFKSSNP